MYATFNKLSNRPCLIETKSKILEIKDVEVKQLQRMVKRANLDLFKTIW